MSQKSRQALPTITLQSKEVADRFQKVIDKKGLNHTRTVTERGYVFSFQTK